MNADVIVLGALTLPIWLPLLLIAASKDKTQGYRGTP